MNSLNLEFGMKYKFRIIKNSRFQIIKLLIY